MKLAEVVATSQRVGSTRSRKDKTQLLAALLQDRGHDTLQILVPWLAGELRQGRVGVGYAALSAVRGTAPSEQTTLSVTDVDHALTALKGIAGKGSKARRHDALVQLLGLCTAPEQPFLMALLAGELRQGALAGVMAEAVAEAAKVPAAEVRRAAMLTGDLVAPALAAFTGGAEALAGFRLEVGRAIQPMLAQTAEDAADAMARLQGVRLEAKLDGARVQVHRSGDRVEVWSRHLRPVTRAVPEVVEAVLALPVEEIVLDGEVLALEPSGRPHAFQTTMRRFGRKLDVAAMRRELPLSVFFFDALHLDGTPLLDRPLSERAQVLEERVPESARVRTLVPKDADEAHDFVQRTLDAGHEGVMAKAQASSYEAGTRGAAWLKIKPAWTLELVVLAVEWGSGRRKGWLSNLHLGALDPGTGGFVMLGKTFKGLTDELLAWQTEQLLAREVRRDGHVVHVRPELVVEIAFNDVQDSPRYPGGVALRFARVKGYRPDKPPSEADTIETVRAIHQGKLRKNAGGRPTSRDQ
ncbi:MAG: ATP-dependent DNA ligase [Myxococcales bacterium]|nr:ATP-dependent DNA ligase [Myxococcales bacterium]